MSERLSVLITTFNRPALVQEAIESVLAQDVGPPFEIVVIDDGSSGETFDALQRFGRAIRYARQDNRGLNPARNHGLRLVQGDLVAILDDDDIWLPFKTRTMLPAIARFPDAGFVHSDFTVWRPATGERRSGGLQRWFPRAIDWAEMYRDRVEIEVPRGPAAGLDADRLAVWHGDLYTWSLYAPMVLPSTAIIRRRALDGHAGFVEENHVGDWEFFARLSHRCGCVFVPAETTLNRSHEDRYRLTRADPRTRLFRRLAMIRRLWRTDAEYLSRHRDELDRIEAGCLRQLARSALGLGDRETAREAMQTIRALPGQGRAGDTVLRAAAAMPGTLAAIQAVHWVRGLGRQPAKTGF
jgi:glycosyltransferase involved in cell wall biosynthesis